MYFRAKINREVFTSSIYLRQKRRNNYTVCFGREAGEKEYGEILSFVCSGNPVEEESKKFAFVKCFKIDHLKMFVHTESKFVIRHIIPIVESENVILVPLENIVCKVIRVGNYVCLRPNNVEVNL